MLESAPLHLPRRSSIVTHCATNRPAVVRLDRLTLSYAAADHPSAADRVLVGPAVEVLHPPSTCGCSFGIKAGPTRIWTGGDTVLEVDSRHHVHPLQLVGGQRLGPVQSRRPNNGESQTQVAVKPLSAGRARWSARRGRIDAQGFQVATDDCGPDRSVAGCRGGMDLEGAGDGEDDPLELGVGSIEDPGGGPASGGRAPGVRPALRQRT
jgi:hypothetical protein